MAAPKKIVYDYSFLDHTVNEPDAPQPGDQLDEAFAEVKRASDETIDRLNLLQRDDGELGRVVGPDQLKEPLFTEFENLANEAEASAQAAKLSETNAAQSATSAAGSVTAAKASETAAAQSATNSNNSAQASAQSATNAAASETAAADYADTAKTWRDQAFVSETNAKTSETNAAASAASASEDAAEAAVILGHLDGGSTGQGLIKKSNTPYDYDWLDLPGGGDMLRSIYDPDGDGIVDNAKNAENAVSAQTADSANSAATVPWSGVSGKPAFGTAASKDVGAALGVAGLDENGKVFAAQLPPMNYLPLAGGTLTGLLTAGAGALFKRGTAGTQSVGQVRIGFADRPQPLWQTVLETNGDLTWGRYNGDTGAWVASPITFKGDGNIAVTGNISAGASGVLEGNGNVWGSLWGTNLWNYLNAAGTLLGAAAYPRRSDGAKMVFNWSGQGGQPTWIWGGNDGVNMYVYNPANWSVNYANSAGTAGNVGGWTAQAIIDNAYAVGYNRTRDYLLAEHVPVGGYVLAQSLTPVGAGGTIAGTSLRWASAGGGPSAGSNAITYGTWQASGQAGSNGGSNNIPLATTLFKRIG